MFVSYSCFRVVVTGNRTCCWGRLTTEEDPPAMTTDSGAERAAIYVRISNDKTGAGLDVGKQEADCSVLAARFGLDVSAVHIDNVISAFNGRMSTTPPGYLDLLADITTRRVEPVMP